MFVLGLVGSPRKGGRTDKLVDAALRGVELKGVEAEKVYLVDYEIKPYVGTGGSEDAYLYCPEELSRLCSKADAIVLGAPVYWGDINGLTKDFMDTVRIEDENGKYALGISIAGGTGKGLLSGIQSIYHFFFHKQFRGIDPTPVSRFNFQEALSLLESRGGKLADLCRERAPFPGQSREERWPYVAAYYASLDYLGCDIVDEFIMLARDLLKSSRGGDIVKARADLEEAMRLASEGKRAEAAMYAVRSYQTLYFPPLEV
ncbi:MAG: flavodoxin family protein [Candidatus Bathyarchaeia archaeon]